MVTVLDSKDLLTHLTTGETPVPPGVAEDNARQKAASEKGNGKPPESKGSDKTSVEGEKKPAVESKEDDTEGEDGLTAAERREYTEKMLRTVARKTRQIREAEEFAAAQYNERVLADQRAANAEAERDSFKQELAKLQPAVRTQETTEPQREKFATEKEYSDAMVDWRVDQKFKAKEAEAAQQRQQAIAQNCEASLTRAMDLVQDFQEVTQAAELNIPGHIVHLMQESGLFAEFGYHFAKNPDDLAKLVISTPNKIKLEFQKIEGKLTPFASRTAAGADGKANGAKPSAKETESASAQTAANGNGADPSTRTESTGNGADPSTRTESTGNGADPSKPRGTAPVITPLSAGGASQVQKPASEMSTREMVQAWQKSNNRNLGLRKRH